MTNHDPNPHAPDFPVDADWVNVAHPLSLEDELCGNVVVLLFWRAGCVHSMHVLQAMCELEPRFIGRPCAFIGVHTGNEPCERDTSFVRRAVVKLGVEFPVLVDSSRSVWEDYGCRAWPTLVLLDASGEIRFRGAGEVDVQRLAEAVDALCDIAEEEGYYQGAPPADRDIGVEGGELAFPTKLAFDPEGGFLWVADTGHHRLLSVDVESGQIVSIVGDGVPGDADGESDRAQFCYPRGLEVHDGVVYVADTGNHAIRAVDLRGGYVTTISGNGRASRDVVGGGGGRGQGLSSPWDLCWYGGEVLVAMAGTNQLWAIEPFTQCATAFAGSGQRGTADGARHDATLAQPMAVASDSSSAIVADAATGRVRRLAGGMVKTVDVGVGRLLHPRAVACDERGSVWVVDTYTGVIRCLQPTDAGSDAPAAPRAVAAELEVGDLELSQPEGLLVLGERVFVADTDNHRVVVIPRGGGAAVDLEIRA